jgi:hypothetical protein
MLPGQQQQSFSYLNDDICIAVILEEAEKIYNTLYINQFHNQPNILYSNKKNRNNFKTINNNRINFLYSLVLLLLSSKSILFITHSLDRERA